MTNKSHMIALRIRHRAEDLVAEHDYLTAASDFALAANHYRAAGEIGMADHCVAEEAVCMAKHYASVQMDLFAEAA
jgi:hypothetical protein